MMDYHHRQDPSKFRAWPYDFSLERKWHLVNLYNCGSNDGSTNPNKLLAFFPPPLVDTDDLKIRLFVYLILKVMHHHKASTLTVNYFF